MWLCRFFIGSDHYPDHKILDGDKCMHPRSSLIDCGWFAWTSACPHEVDLISLRQWKRDDSKMWWRWDLGCSVLRFAICEKYHILFIYQCSAISRTCSHIPHFWWASDHSTIVILSIRYYRVIVRLRPFPVLFRFWPWVFLAPSWLTNQDLELMDLLT